MSNRGCNSRGWNSRSAIPEMIAAQKRGEIKGIASICSANPWVIEAVLQHASHTGEPVLIESTCNQVNQFGGYMGLTPAGFVAYLRDIASRQDFPFDQILIGGDHQGPSPWQDEPASAAMEKAQRLVQECARAGYAKIHLDASMKCADDDPGRPLDIELAAARAADLALAVETAIAQQLPGGRGPYYVIGTEVPLPGGAQKHEENLVVTTTDEAAAAIEASREAFLARGLAQAWERVVAVVVQPGVEYGSTTVHDYEPERAADLARYIEDYGGLVYEAHSTDYQLPWALGQLVADHFAILKVGPALTFALREGIYALAGIEDELLRRRRESDRSRVRERLDEAMLANPTHWQKHYEGDEPALEQARKYSYSDRSRYYWTAPAVQRSLSQLLQNLAGQALPMTLLSQFLPVQYGRIRRGDVSNEPRAILLDKVGRVLSDYSYACGYQGDGSAAKNFGVG